MKNISIALSVLGLFIITSCSTEVTVTDVAVSEEKIGDTLSETVSNFIFTDTLNIGKYTLIISQTDSSYKLVDYPNPELSYYKTINADTIEQVSVQEDTLSFELQNGGNLNLANVNYTDDEENFLETVSYEFVNDIENYWQVEALCYEYDFTLLFNKFNGDTIRTIDPGPISPSKDLIICSNVDLESMFTENGIEIFELTPTSHKKVGFIELIEYGLNDMEWISQNKLKAVKVMVTDNYKYELSNVTIEVIKK